MRIAGFLSLAILVPASAHAAVIFTEIMYDVSDTDTGREWVEITNTGSSAMDASGYKFFEANTNHALTLASGDGMLAPGGSAVIANDPTKFKTDWPGYTGILFDSSFSLSNTGESLALKDGALTVLDSVSYDSSLGAAGDGNSLQWNGSAFASAAPTPGTYAGTGGASNASVTASSTQETSSSSGSASTYTPPPSALSLSMSGSRDAVLEVPLHLFARATIKSGAVDPTAQITWSFGDGSSGTGTAVEKLYRYAGTYLVTVDATDGAAKAHDEMIVTARPAAVRLFMASGDGITIANDANERLDLSLWRLLSETGSFRIPDGTVILPKTSALFPFAVTNLPITLDVTLLYPDGIIAARLSPFTAPAPATTTVASVPERQPSPASAGYKEVQAVESITRARTDVQQHEEAVLAPAATTELAAAGAALPALSVAASSTERKRALGIFRSPWTLGFLGVMMLAGGAFIFL